MGNAYSNLRDFTSQSFRIPAPPLTEKNLPDQSGKVFMITGGYAGVGAQLSSILYSKNATVWIAGRSDSKAQKTIDSIRAEHPNSKGILNFLKVDLSDLTTIKPAAEEFLSKETKLNWLNHNAGIMVPPKDSKGAQGIDLQYQTNILGPFLLTKFLQPILKKTATSEPKGTVRVSWAGSLAVGIQSPAGGVRFTEDGKDLFQFGPPTAYGVSKAANYLLATEFGKRSGVSDGILHNSYNPGNLASELQRHAKDAYGAAANFLFGFLLYPPVFGAYTELYSGLSKDLTIEKDQGGYFVPWGRKTGVRKDIEAERKEGGNASKLYEWCDQVTKQHA